MIKLVDFMLRIFYHSKKKKKDKKTPENTVLHSGMKKQMELASDGV